jgi:3-carboxy-cis,cis-muconate cycloisomerase
LFGLASGALREGRALAEGLVVDVERMRANLDMTRGLLFADAAAARLGARLSREAAHALVEQAAGEVRRTGKTLRAVLERTSEVRETGVDVGDAFDLAPAITAGGVWVDRALGDAARVRARLSGEA